MSKLMNNRALLSILVLSCASAAAVAADLGAAPALKLSGDLVGSNAYECDAGTYVEMNVVAQPGDLVFVFAVTEDAWGEPDYNNVLILMAGVTKDGLMSGGYIIPKELAGQTFFINAGALDSKGDWHWSDEATLMIRKNVDQE